MSQMRTFYARVEFTDERGVHTAGESVNLPYGNDTEIAAALSLVAYGVVSTTAPAQVEEPAPAPSPTAPLVGPGPMVYATAEAQAAATVEVHDHAVPGADEAPASNAPHPDNPETPFHDARDADGKFTSDRPGVQEPAKAPAKRSGRRRK